MSAKIGKDWESGKETILSDSEIGKFKRKELQSISQRAAKNG
jgi:hypothetical protein